MVAEWAKKGGQTYQLIEPVDGFHPSQWAQPLITDITWQLLRQNQSQMIPPTNPNNARIESIFGDQGGY